MDSVRPLRQWFPQEAKSAELAPTTSLQFGGAPWTWVSWTLCVGGWRRRAGWPGVVVPLLDGANGLVRRRAAREVRRSASSWAGYRVEEYAKYLGYPRVGAVQGDGAVTRWRQCCREIAAVGMPIQAAASTYRARALLVLFYVAQMAEAPSRIDEAGRFEVCRLWRLPANTLARGRRCARDSGIPESLSREASQAVPPRTRQARGQRRVRASSK